MKFSIIVPFKNAEKYLDACINSILARKNDEIELILVDDNSLDASYELCKSFANKYPNIILVRSVGYGVSAARNTGLRHAKGDIIGFCDADDTYCDDWKSLVENAFSVSANINIVVGSIIKSGFENKHKMLKEAIIENKEVIFEKILVDNSFMGSVCNKFYLTNVIKCVIFNENLTHCEDTCFNIEILKRNEKLKFHLIDKPTYKYNTNINSATMNRKNLFDKEGNLKYNLSFNYVLNRFGLSHFEERLIKQAIFWVSVENYNSTKKCSENRKLYKYISCYWLDHFFMLFRNDIRANCSMLYRGMLILIKDYQIMKK